ncbi:MAG: T9SS type A sorting domain-containing protein [Candidatus Cloacimonetes bacterium]|nr:T9SS type A sorting domain-containing protein [Candidatus Cloacimonadota bacterium]
MKKSLFFTVLCCIVFSLSLHAEWSSNPSVNTGVCTLPGEDAIPKVVAGPLGDIYVGYFANEEGNYNVRLQRYDAAGNALWASNGILVSDNTAMTWLTDWDMTVDHDNSAILTFQDIRDGNNNVYAYRISPEGTFVWGANGLQLSNSTAFDAAPKVAVTSSNNAVVVWSSDDVARLQKISPEGTLLWGATGIEISGTNSYTWPQPIAVENDMVIVKYFEDSGVPWAPTRYIYAQKYDANGNALWAPPCAISTAGSISAWTQDLAIIPDSNFGFFIGWHDDRDSNMNADVYVQHVNSSGTCLFLNFGVPASTNTGNEHYYPFLAYLENTQMLYVYWNEMDADQNNRGIYGQKFNMTGTRLWEDSGRMILPLTLTDIYPFGIGHTDTFVSVYYTEGLVDDHVKAMALDSNGDFLWPGNSVTMCSVNSSKVHPVVSTLTGSQWIAGWEDERSGRDIYAQNINTDGTLGYIPVSVEPEYDASTALLTAAPNPFLSSTTLKFNKTTRLLSDTPQQTEIKIYNIKGQLIRKFPFTSSTHLSVEVTWDGKDENGNEVVQGIYLFKASISNEEFFQKVVKIQ